MCGMVRRGVRIDRHAADGIVRTAVRLTLIGMLVMMMFVLMHCHVQGPQ